MHILALDPGGRTGWVHWYEGAWDFGTLGPRPHHWQLYLKISEWSGGAHITIVCERFENRNDQFAVLTSNEYIGVVRAWEQSHPSRCHLYMQGSSQALRWSSDAKLNALGLLRPGMDKDNRAAMRHLVYFICNNQATQGTLERAAFMGELKKLVQG